MKRILFVCTGNTCRSPMAAAILKQMGVETKSAGVFASNGSDASTYTKQVLSENNIEVTHSSQTMTQELVDWATHIFTMTESQKYHLSTSFPSAVGKTFTVKEYVNENGDVVDPYGGEIEVYRLTYSELNELMKKVIEKLEKEQ